MNLILLESAETRQVFPARSLQAVHLREVLKVAPGATFWCGVENGLRGIATVEDIDSAGNITFFVAWENTQPPLLPAVRLLVGLSRPQTMKKIFAAASEIGCAAIHVFVTERGDPAYAQSSLWRDGDKELHEILKKSAEQTCTTFLPEVRLFDRLEAAAESFPGVKILLDVYASEAFPQILQGKNSSAITLAIGSERGWTDAERNVLCGNGFIPAHIGGRVLRVETATAVALSVALAQLDFWTPHKKIETK